MPWFKNELSVSSTDVLELRAICDSTFVDEDIVIAEYRPILLLSTLGNAN